LGEVDGTSAREGPVQALVGAVQIANSQGHLALEAGGADEVFFDPLMTGLLPRAIDEQTGNCALATPDCRLGEISVDEAFALQLGLSVPHVKRSTQRHVAVSMTAYRTG
jgi:hypothetical protein